MHGRSGPRLSLVAMVLVALVGLAVVGRMLGLDPAVPSTSTQAPTLTSTAVQPVETSTSRGVLVPDAVGKSLAEGRRLMRRAGLRGAAIETDPQAPTSRIFGQEPPPGVWVPPGGVVGFRTKPFSDFLSDG
jgi:hypothetical protein